jgi:hypothetical protein
MLPILMLQEYRLQPSLPCKNFECINKASEIEDVEDQKKMQGMAEGIYERLVTYSG